MAKLLKKLLLLVPVPAVVFAVTWTVDPANIRSDGSYEAGIVEIMLSGRNVANLINYNEREVQKKLVAGLAKTPEIIVIGSSRSMGIDSRTFPGKPFMNSSVSGASVEDHLAIFNLYRVSGKKPGTVVISMDPWLLNRNNAQERWIHLSEDYFGMRSALGFAPDAAAGRSADLGKLKKFSEFLSPSYFNRALIGFLQGGVAADDYHATDDAEGEMPIKIADGSYVYGRKFRGRDSSIVDSAARTDAMARPIYSLGKFKELDQSAMQLLDGFAAYLRKENIRLIFFLAPYHPIVYAAIEHNPDYVNALEAEKWYRLLAAKHKVPVIGSYNPGTVKLGSGDFYDGMHPTNEVVQALFRN